MSYNTDLQNNNTSLQEILATVNSLPEAGGSSGGGECFTVTIVNDSALEIEYQVAYLDSSKNFVGTGVDKYSTLLPLGGHISFEASNFSTFYYHIQTFISLVEISDSASLISARNNNLSGALKLNQDIVITIPVQSGGR